LNDGGVKVLRQKDETKNKKKIAEIEIEIKTIEFFSDFQTVLLSKGKDEILETGLLTF
jgi:hypothetical protein